MGRLVGVGLLVLAAVAVPFVRARTSAGGASELVCRPLAAIAGPEDLELQLDAPGGPRALVSSDDRRRPRRKGAIWSVPLSSDGAAGPAPAARLPLLGRDRCTFHPHGISLVEMDSGGTRLYVINHHEASDWRSDSGCLAGPAKPERARKFSSVEVYLVDDRGLRFLARLGDPELLPRPNDLVALPDGRIFATNPAQGIAMLSELILEENHGSSVVRFVEGASGCPGRGRGGPWCALPLGPHAAFANGIAYARASEREVLYVASNANGQVLALPLVDPPVVASPVGSPRLCRGGPDNLLWKSKNERVLVAAVHPNLRRFVQHALDPRVASPSEVWELDVVSGSSRRLLADGGGVISAASVAAFWPAPEGDSLILGQVFGHQVVQCLLPPPAVATGR